MLTWSDGEARFLRCFLISEASKQALFEFSQFLRRRSKLSFEFSRVLCRFLRLRSKLSCSCFEFWAFGASCLRVVSSSEASKQAFFEFSRVQRLRTWLSLSFLARAVVILNALAVIVGRSQTFSVQASFETGNPPERVPRRSRNGAATPAGGPVETSWTSVGCLWSLWGCLGLLRGSPGYAPGPSEGRLGSVLRCSENTSGNPFSSSASKR